MNDFEGLLASDFRFKPQGKSAPMVASSSSSSAASKPSPTLNPTSDLNFDLESRHPPQPTWISASFNRSTADDQDSIFGSGANRKTPDFDDLFGGSARSGAQSQSSRFDSSSSNFDSVFSGLNDFSTAKSSSSSGLHDKPVYDDDIFEGLPGINNSSSGKYESAFSSFSSMPKGSGGFDDLLAGFGKSEPESKSSKSGGSRNVDSGSAGFEDLIPGFGKTSPPTERSTSGPSWHSEPTFSASKTTSDATENPFVVLESSSPAAAPSSKLFTDPLEEISKLDKSGNLKIDNSSSDDGKSYDDMDPFDGLGKFAPTYASDRKEMEKDSHPVKTDQRTNESQTYANKEQHEKTSIRSPERSSVDSDQETHETMFDMPKVPVAAHKSAGRAASPPLHSDANFSEADLHQADMSSGSEERFDSSDDVWLTVSEIPLYTEPTTAPPPSRPPPPRPTRIPKDKTRPFSSVDARTNDNDFVNFNARSSVASPFDEFEDFAQGRSQNDGSYHANGLSSEDFEMSSTAAASAAAMKDAMDRAEAKFRHAKEARERETTKSSRSRQQLDKDEKASQDAQDRARREKQERLDHERIQRELEEEERLQKRLEKERERAKEIEREREEKEQRRVEKERERAREIEREREQARQAVQRATREARERAAAEARLKAERAAVGKINAEARERAERIAVQRAQAEARERAAAEARGRAEKAAAEARVRANSEAREKEEQERAAAAKAEAEARLRAERAAVQRAAQEARERAAAAARLNQQKNENDLDSFFSAGRASSAPRPRATSSDPMFDTQFQNNQGPGVPKTSGTSSMKKASSATNFDDLASIFGGGAPSSGDFQDVEGESEERRRARLERHQRTQERAAKALAEKNQRDLQAQRDQAERHRIAETLDIEIKRWAAGKEGNLRALLSTLQYVLWPECGWQPVSLTDLITAAMVKKVYRKSTLCIHPDKVQQKGATLQQKYIAEKVFDILKEAWNKFNSEELF